MLQSSQGSFVLFFLIQHSAVSVTSSSYQFSGLLWHSQQISILKLCKEAYLRVVFILILDYCLNVQTVNSIKLCTNNIKLCLRIQKEVASSKFRYVTLQLILFYRLVVDTEGMLKPLLPEIEGYTVHPNFLPYFSLNTCPCWKDDSRPEGPDFIWQFSHKRAK